VTAGDIKVSLTVIKTGNGRGVIKSDPNGIACGKTCSADFDQGSFVTLTARAHEEDKFQRWGGACANVKTQSCVVTMDAAKTVSAIFRRRR
jgi:hypothetical protein